MTSFRMEHYPNDPSIENETELLRRIPPWHFILDQNLGRFRPSSAAFEDDDANDPMSVCLRTVLTAENREVATVLAGHSGYALASITAGLARGHNQTVYPDPLPEETAHAVVCGMKKSSVKKSFSRSAKWVVQPPPHA
jgi:hypothetical protein